MLHNNSLVKAGFSTEKMDETGLSHQADQCLHLTAKARCLAL